LKKQIVKNFIIVMLFISLALIVIPKMSYATSVSPDKYKPQIPSTSLTDSDETVSETNKPIKSMESQVSSLIFIIIITTLIYFIPTGICLIRKHTYKFYIICLNIILGWTLIGWIVSLIWSFIDNKKTEK